MANETNKTVTISADYFAELYETAKAASIGLQDRVRLAKGCDELKEKLNAARDASNDFESRLAAAEWCIEDISNVMCDGVIADCAEGMKVQNIIRAWREKREAK